MQVIEAKPVYFYPKAKKTVKAGDQKQRTNKILVGYRVRFDDGVKVEITDQFGNKKTHVGHGTTVFQSFNRKTKAPMYSVALPIQPKRINGGFVATDTFYTPIWEKPNKERTQTLAEFKATYSRDGVLASWAEAALRGLSEAKASLAKAA